LRQQRATQGKREHDLSHERFERGETCWADLYAIGRVATGFSSLHSKRQCLSAYVACVKLPLLPVQLQLIQRPRPVTLEQPRHRPIGKQTPVGLARYAIVGFVGRIANALHG
jgi:hypothetical protein